MSEKYKENLNCRIAEALGWSDFEWVPSDQMPIPSMWYGVKPGGNHSAVPDYKLNASKCFKALEDFINNRKDVRYDIRSPLLAEKRGFYEVSISRKDPNERFWEGIKEASGLGITFQEAFIECMKVYIGYPED